MKLRLKNHSNYEHCRCLKIMILSRKNTSKVELNGEVICICCCLNSNANFICIFMLFKGTSNRKKSFIKSGEILLVSRERSWYFDFVIVSFHLPRLTFAFYSIYLPRFPLVSSLVLRSHEAVVLPFVFLSYFYFFPPIPKEKCNVGMC